MKVAELKWDITIQFMKSNYEVIHINENTTTLKKLDSATVCQLYLFTTKHNYKTIN